MEKNNKMGFWKKVTTLSAGALMGALPMNAEALEKIPAVPGNEGNKIGVDINANTVNLSYDYENEEKVPELEGGDGNSPDKFDFVPPKDTIDGYEWLGVKPFNAGTQQLDYYGTVSTEHMKFAFSGPYFTTDKIDTSQLVNLFDVDDMHNNQVLFYNIGSDPKHPGKYLAHIVKFPSNQKVYRDKDGNYFLAACKNRILRVKPEELPPPKEITTPKKPVVEKDPTPEAGPKVIEAKEKLVSLTQFDNGDFQDTKTEYAYHTLDGYSIPYEDGQLRTVYTRVNRDGIRVPITVEQFNNAVWHDALHYAVQPELHGTSFDGGAGQRTVKLVEGEDGEYTLYKPIKAKQ